jgi:hypothetical protein
MNSLLVLKARAEARALLFRCADYEDSGEAITPLLVYAYISEMDEEIRLAIIQDAFKRIAGIEV